jgi:hypothetical protein
LIKEKVYLPPTFFICYKEERKWILSLAMACRDQILHFY